MRRSRAVIGIPVPHQLAFPQQHVAAKAGHLISCFLLGGGVRDDHLAEQSAALDVGRREGDSDLIRGWRRCGATRSAARDGQEYTCTVQSVHVDSILSVKVGRCNKPSGGSGGVSRSSSRRSSGSSCCHAVFLLAALNGAHGLSFSVEHGVRAFVSLAERGDARKQLADTLQWHRSCPC